jgi:speckle-type POZ protein
VILCNRSNEEVRATYFEIALNDKDGILFREATNPNNHTLFVPIYPSSNERRGWGDYKFVRRDDVLDDDNDLLNGGTLTFHVKISVDPANYRPADLKATLANNIFNKFGDRELADVAFKVKRNVFYAHKIILKARAPELFELTEQFDKETRMPINDVVPKNFELMLKYIYGKQIEASEWRQHSKEIIQASGKYGFSALREEAEIWHMKTLSVENVVEELLYANGNHCKFLKSTAMKFI